MIKSITSITAALLFTFTCSSFAGKQQFDSFLKPLFEKNCNQCHGKKKTKGKVNLYELTTYEKFMAKPDLIKEVIEAVDANDMPPEDEPQLTEKEKAQLIAALKSVLQQSASGQKIKEIAFKRLNRFQYNYTVKDLFKLKKNLFHLPEKIMTRRANYLGRNLSAMPEKVDVHSASLGTGGGLKGIESFPQDLRASHGFDNQSDQLSLPPILLDSFLKLSLSIVNSPDFNKNLVGIWKEFFLEPTSKNDLNIEVKKRLTAFLSRAFRSNVDDATIERYTNYTMAKINSGLPFTEAMKKAASAVLASPIFLHSINSIDPQEKDYNLASKLSYFLWGSSPDDQLLSLAAKGQLSQKDNLDKSIERMLKDVKIERFLDTFPSQWMQLETIFSVRPDPKLFRNFTLNKNKPVPPHMVLEPLLLFDTVFIENRPIMELIKPDFSYQNDFLKKWYSLNNKTVDPVKQAAEDKKSIAARLKLRQEQETAIAKNILEKKQMLAPYKEKFIQAKNDKTGKVTKFNLKPYASWNFNGNLNDSVSSLHLKSHGKTKFKDGMISLKRTYLESGPLPIELKAKTFEVWLKMNNIKQKGGGAMTVQALKGDFFDSIVYGERKKQHWISGSNAHARTKDFPGSYPEKQQHKMTHLVMVYSADGTVTMYKDGKPYGKPYKTKLATFTQNQSKILFGLRHLPAGGDRFLDMTLDQARLYNRALSPHEVKTAYLSHDYIDERLITKQLSQKEKKALQTKNRLIEQITQKLAKNPVFDKKGLIRDRQMRADQAITNTLNSNIFTRIPATDPRYGGIITNAAMLTMTSAPKRTQPITRGAWVIEVIFNDPPPPPPNDVPPLDEDAMDKKLTIKETFAEHRKNPDCAGCHSRLDPLGFVLESFDGVGLWRDKYKNRRDVDPSGILLKKYPYKNIVDFKEAITKEKDRFAKAFIRHMLRFSLARKLTASEALLIDKIAAKTKKDDYRLQSIIREVILSKSFSGELVSSK